jgi:hypothetical protein
VELAWQVSGGGHSDGSTGLLLQATPPASTTGASNSAAAPGRFCAIAT